MPAMSRAWNSSLLCSPLSLTLSPEGERENDWLGLQPVFEALGEAGRGRLALDQVVERPQADSAFDQLPLVPVGQDYDWDLRGRRVAPEGFENAEAVQFWKPDIEKDDVRRCGPCFFQRSQAVARYIHGVAVELQLEPVHLSHRGIVLDEEDAYIIGVGGGPLIHFPSFMTCNA